MKIPESTEFPWVSGNPIFVDFDKKRSTIGGTVLSVCYRSKFELSLSPSESVVKMLSFTTLLEG